MHPHQSLDRAGLLVLLVLVVLASVGLGAAFALAGAWPVSGFLGLDVLLLLVAFHLTRRAGRRAEYIELDAGGLVVRRIEADGRTLQWRFEPYWVRVDMDDPPRHDSRLTLTSHGRSVAVGSFLAPEERLELARALHRALRLYKEPPLATRA